ncbi:hypothetical protein JC607_07130 [Paracoccus sp. IB05]|nr:hypothetical protein [Paracoccus sp. IB05]
MTGIFDGMTGILSDVFGAPVIWQPPGSQAETVQSIFRRVPVEVVGAGGEPVLAMQPIWRVRRGSMSRAPKAGDQIQPGDGRTYRITAVQEGGSPAGDRFVTCELELVT